MSLAKTTRHIAHLVSAPLFGRLLGLISLPILLRLYQPEEYARYGLFLAVGGLLAIATDWLHTAAARFGREELDGEGTLRATFWSLLLLKIPFCGLLLVLLVSSQELILRFTQLPPTLLAALVAFTLLRLFGGLGDLLQAQERFAGSAWTGQLSAFLTLAAALLILTGVLPPRAMVLVWASLLGSALVTLTYLRLLGSLIWPARIQVAWLLSILQFSWPFLFHMIGGYTIDYVDIYVIRRFLPLEDVGIYTVAYSLFRQISIPLLSLSSLILPRLLTLYNTGQQDPIKWFYQRIAPQIVFFTGQLVALALILLPLVRLFVGPYFASALRPFSVLLAGLGLTVVIVLMLPLFYAAKRPGVHVAANLLMAAVNLGLDLILVPRIGILGAAFGTLAAVMLGLILQVWWFRSIFGFSVGGGLTWTFPCWIILCCSLRWPESLAPEVAWIVCSGWAWWWARRRGLFDHASADFFRKLGFPDLIRHWGLLFYRRVLVRPSPATLTP